MLIQKIETTLLIVLLAFLLLIRWLYKPETILFLLVLGLLLLGLLLLGLSHTKQVHASLLLLLTTATGLKKAKGVILLFLLTILLILILLHEIKRILGLLLLLRLLRLLNEVEGVGGLLGLCLFDKAKGCWFLWLLGLVTHQIHEVTRLVVHTIVITPKEVGLTTLVGLSLLIGVAIGFGVAEQIVTEIDSQLQAALVLISLTVFIEH